MMVLFPDECVDKELRARITMPASDNIYGVHLFDASDATAPSINSLLIERGFAVSVGTTKASPSKTEDAEILGRVLYQCLVTLHILKIYSLEIHKLSLSALD